jgi:hypothetical protein
LQGALGKEFFLKKIKNCLCRRPLPGALGTGFFPKKEKQPLPTAFARGLGTKISKNNKTPIFADGPASRPSAKKISKIVNLTPR